MSKNNAGTTAGSGALYGLGIFGALGLLLDGGGRRVGARLRDLPGRLLASGSRGLRGVLSAQRLTHAK